MNRRTFVAALMAGAFAVATLPAIAAVSSPAAAAEKVKIAVVLKTLSSQYWKIVAAGAQAAADKNNVDLIVLGPPTPAPLAQTINIAKEKHTQKQKTLNLSP